MEDIESKEAENKAIDEPLYLLIIELSKKIVELDRKLSKILVTQDDISSKENNIHSSVEKEKDLFIGLKHNLDNQFENVDKLLGRYFQKFTRDNNRLFERLNDMEKSIESIKSKPISPKTGIVKPKVVKKTPLIQPKVEARDFIDSVPVTEDFNADKNEIFQLKNFFNSKNVFTTGAIKVVEETRDKLLFERDTEAPYRALAAKVFREVLSIIKSEKDFSTLSSQATKDILHRIDLVQERIG